MACIYLDGWLENNKETGARQRKQSLPWLQGYKNLHPPDFHQGKKYRNSALGNNVNGVTCRRQSCPKPNQCKLQIIEILPQVGRQTYHALQPDMHNSSYYLYKARDFKYRAWHRVNVANGLMNHWLKLDKWPLGLKLDVSPSFRATVRYDWPLLCWQKFGF